MGKPVDQDQTGDIPHVRKEDRPDFAHVPLSKKGLPKSITDTLNSEEKMGELLDADTPADLNDTQARYAAYAARARTILRSAHRYIAYTSDVGESFRPIAHPFLVTGAYAVSWAYLIGDVSYEGYKAYQRNQMVLNPEKLAASPLADKNTVAAAIYTPDASTAVATLESAAKDLVQPTPAKIAPLDDYRTVMAQRAVFQSVASMGLPAFTIHSIVKYSGRALKNSANKSLRTWAPIGLGLAVVPALPYLFDKPVEEAVEWTFHKGFETFGGKNAVKPHEKEL